MSEIMEPMAEATEQPAAPEKNPPQAEKKKRGA